MRVGDQWGTIGGSWGTIGGQWGRQWGQLGVVGGQLGERPGKCTCMGGCYMVYLYGAWLYEESGGREGRRGLVGRYGVLVLGR